MQRVTRLAWSSPAPTLTEDGDTRVGFGKSCHLLVPPESTVSKEPTQILSSGSAGKSWLLLRVLRLPSVRGGSSETAVAGVYSRPLGKGLKVGLAAGSYPKVLSVLATTLSILPT